MAITVKESVKENDTEKTASAPLFTLDQVREHAKFSVMLPLDPTASSAVDQCEFPEVNGVITQVKRGELVQVNYKVLRALLDSGRYDTSIIRG